MITYQDLTENFVLSTVKLAYKIFKPTKQVDYNLVIKDFSSTNSKCFIAVEEDNVVGFVTFNIFKPLFTDFPKAHISWIAVEENHRHKGIAKVLLQMTEQYCKTQNCKYVDLSSKISVEREAAHKLYESFGFKSNTQKYFIKHF